MLETTAVVTLDTIKQVKKRLGILQTLEMEIDYELTISHADI